MKDYHKRAIAEGRAIDTATEDGVKKLYDHIRKKLSIFDDALGKEFVEAFTRGVTQGFADQINKKDGVMYYGDIDISLIGVFAKLSLKSYEKLLNEATEKARSIAKGEA